MANSIIICNVQLKETLSLSHLITIVPLNDFVSLDIFCHDSKYRVIKIA